MSAGRRRDVFRLWGATAVFVAALGAASWWQVQRSRAAAVDAAETLVEQQLAAAETGLNRLLMGVDLGLASLAEPLQQAQRPDGTLDPASAGRLLDQLNEARLELTDAALVDAAGRTLAASLPSSERNGLPLPKGLIDRALALPVPQLVVSEPVASPVTGERVLLLARTLPVGAGERLVAVAQVQVDTLSTLLGRVPDGVVVTVELDDGLLLASMPPNDPLVGTRLAPPLPRGVAAAEPTLQAARLDGGAAIVASRPTVYPAVLLSVGYAERAMLAGWRGERNTVLAVLGVMVALALAAGALAHWTVVRLRGARADIARSGAMLDQALASMADGFMLCDADDRVVRWNGRYLELFPWLRQVLVIGLPYRRLAETAAAHLLANGTEAERQAWIERRMALHREGGEWAAELEGSRAVTAMEVRLPDGGTVGVYHDVTAAERRLAKAKAAAEEANEAKSRFLATMSHELRTPLNAVLGLNALMLDSTLTPEQRRHAELIRSSGRLLLSIISDVLDLSKIEAGRLTLDMAPFDAMRAAAEVVALLRERADAKGLRLTLDVSPDVPPLLENDSARVRQVMFNLIGNALKFTDRGEVRVRLGCEAAGPGRVDLVLEVADTGIGIAPAVMPQLFQRFTQADTSTARRHGGSGLGLAISHEFVALMGGRIDVQSREGEGSVFTARMPCRCLQSPERAAPEPPVADHAVGPLHVLAAEDNPVNQFVIQAVLESLGHTSEIVPDGAAAVRRVREGGIDLVLMDLQMPVMDGEDATRAIRALPGPAGRTPIVAMTANARVEDREACLAAGMDDYVVKPVERDALVEAMTGAVQRRRVDVAA